jgi:hypothetical protein
VRENRGGGTERSEPHARQDTRSLRGEVFRFSLGIANYEPCLLREWHSSMAAAPQAPMNRLG